MKFLLFSIVKSAREKKSYLSSEKSDRTETCQLGKVSMQNVIKLELALKIHKAMQYDVRKKVSQTLVAYCMFDLENTISGLFPGVFEFRFGHRNPEAQISKVISTPQNLYQIIQFDELDNLI